MHHDFRETLTTHQHSAWSHTEFCHQHRGSLRADNRDQDQRLPVHNITARAVHIHHYLPGTGLRVPPGAFGSQQINA